MSSCMDNCYDGMGCMVPLHLVWVDGTLSERSKEGPATRSCLLPVPSPPMSLVRASTVHEENTLSIVARIVQHLCILHSFFNIPSAI